MYKFDRFLMERKRKTGDVHQANMSVKSKLAVWAKLHLQFLFGQQKLWET